MERLKKMQKPAGVQIDERVDARIEGKMDSTVIATVQNILADNLHPMAFKNPGSKNKKKHKSRSGNKKHKSGQSNPIIVQTAGMSNNTAPIQPTPINTTATILPTQFVQPTSSGNTNEGQNIQYVSVPMDQLPFLSFKDFEAGGSVHSGPAGGSFRGRGRRGRGGRGFVRNQGERDAYSMDVAPCNIFENQVIPM